jgi:anthranilate synthase component 1
MDISLNKFRPVHKKIKINTSPLLVYEKILEQEEFAFIYESLESRGVRGRYSFLGSKPFLIFESKGNNCKISFSDKTHTKTGNPFDILKELVKGYNTSPESSQGSESAFKEGPFPGGAVGYIAYDAIRYFEEIPDQNPDYINTQDLYFIFPEEIIIFDHKKRTMDLIVYSEDDGQERLKNLEAKIEGFSTFSEPSEIILDTSLIFESNFTEESFSRIVERAKEYILAGDIFQVVLSQRFTFQFKEDPINIYKALRITNPSPYMYYLHFKDLHVIGSSPETLVQLTDKKVVTRPLAGTRRRGKSIEEDDRLEIELLNDEKEKAEHIMLVDLARNDIGRVCVYGSVKPTYLLEIERYSKVMHIVSNVEGEIGINQDAFDLLKSTFPAGTVSGSPKIRAMEIIDELEPVKRGIYAGAIGYFSFNGDMDNCITIRTVIVNDGTGIIQAGAGIVADSKPRLEYKETMNKANALLSAVEMKLNTKL